MAEEDISEDKAGSSGLKQATDDGTDAQVNRMAVCARLGKWIVMAAIAVCFVLFVSRCAGNFLISTSGVRHQNLRTKSTMKDIQVALGHYRTEYDKFPLSGPTLKKDVHLRSQGQWVAALMAGDTTLNLKGIKFLDVTPAKNRENGFYQDNGEWMITDRWGEMYYVIFDVDLDNRIANPEARPGNLSDRIPEWINSTVVIYSSGPDRDPNTWKDNICSWR
jgi:hypothetical protein